MFKRYRKMKEMKYKNPRRKSLEKSLKKSCNPTFSRIFEISLSQFLLVKIARKFMYNIYIIRNNNDAIWVHISVRGAAIPYFQNS